MPHTTLYAAPMEGLTTYLWRQAHRTIFGGVDKYFTPFLSPNANLCFQRKELYDTFHAFSSLCFHSFAAAMIPESRKESKGVRCLVSARPACAWLF